MPSRLTWRALGFGTDDLDIVTFAKAVAPPWLRTVKVTDVEEATTFDIVASLVIETVQPVPQPLVVTD